MDDDYLPLHWAIQDGDKSIFNSLLEDIDIDAQDLEEQTPLHLAVEYFCDDMVEMLVHHGANINIQDKNGNTALIRAVTRNPGVVQFLLNSGASIDTKNNDGHTAIYCATKKGNEAMIGNLLEKGADIDIQNCHGKTALHTAIGDGNLGIVRILLQKGASTEMQDIRGRTAIHYAMANLQNYETILEILLKYGANINARNTDGATAFNIAISTHSYARAAILLMKGAGIRINDVDGDGYGLLHRTVLEGDYAGLEFLLENGANPGIQDRNGQTPLALAVQEKNGKMEKLLLSKGANPTVLDGSENLSIRDNSGLGTKPEMSDDPMNSNCKPHFQELVEGYKKLHAPETVTSGTNDHDWVVVMRNEWHFSLLCSSMVQGAGYLVMVFSIVGQSKWHVHIPLGQISYGDFPQEFPLDLVAAAIFYFFGTQKANEFFAIQEPFAPYVLSCPDEILAQLLNNLFTKMGVPWPCGRSAVRTSTPETWQRNSTAYTNSKYHNIPKGYHYEPKDLKQIMSCANCFKLFLPNSESRCSRCEYRSYCSAACKQSAWNSDNNGMPAHRSECMKIYYNLKHLTPGYRHMPEYLADINLFPPFFQSAAVFLGKTSTCDNVLPVPKPITEELSALKNHLDRHKLGQNKLELVDVATVEKQQEGGDVGVNEVEDERLEGKGSIHKGGEEPFQSGIQLLEKTRAESSEPTWTWYSQGSVTRSTFHAGYSSPRSLYERYKLGYCPS